MSSDFVRTIGLALALAGATFLIPSPEARGDRPTEPPAAATPVASSSGGGDLTAEHTTSPSTDSEVPLANAAGIAERAAPVVIDTVGVRGLIAPVEVRRDRWGVPHIYAGNTHDLFFAQGYVAAQDRLFQMEMWRRQGEGRLAEILGPTAAARDKFARLFAYRGNMQREWASYAPDTREIVAAFVQGVNARIADVGSDLPPEFGLLGFKPEPWSVTVPLSRATGLSGVSNGASEVLRARLVARLGAARVDSLLPTDPARPLDVVAGMDYGSITEDALGGFASTFADVAYNRLEGSNNWVVSGRRTTTGKAILANDPHRVITNPAVRYITHLVAPGWNVIGAGEPASPGVAIGHNDRIAFGLTVVGMDQMDVYVEQLGSCQAAARTRSRGRASSPPIAQGSESLGCYRYRGTWRPLQRLIDTIKVKGEAPRITTLQFTVHGPIVSVDSAAKRAFAIRSVHREPGTAAYLASLSLNRAQNWRQFQAAMARWYTPSENMIYADVDGNIGWVAAGLMPQRSWSGLLPVPGDGSHEWSGFVPGSALPRAYNPSDGVIATANHNILPSGYGTHLSYEWASRYRIDRVREVLASRERFSVEDFQRLQHDDLSKLAQALVPHLAGALRRAGRHETPEGRFLVDWNFRMSREQVAPTLFSAWAPLAYRTVMTRLLADVPEAASLVAGRPQYEWLEEFLSGQNPRRLSAGAVDSLLLAAWDGAIADVTRRFGAGMEQWRWGQVHTASFRHPLSSRYDLPAVSRGGDANTVYATGGANFRQSSGASFREIIDLSDFDKSVVTNVPGQSGDPRSPHYKDLLPLWGQDQYFPLVFSRARVEQETQSVLWLRPAR